MRDTTGLLQESIFQKVRDERARQDAEHGANRSLPADTWFRLLGEEYGEVAEALNNHLPPDELTAELVQVMAVACCWLEDLERQRIAKIAQAVAIGVREKLRQQRGY